MSWWAVVASVASSAARTPNSGASASSFAVGAQQHFHPFFHHVTSANAAWTWSMVTVLALARADAMSA